MKIWNDIRAFFTRRDYHVLRQGVAYDWECSRYRFGETIYLNIVELLTDIYAEVIWTPQLGFNTPLFRAWKRFVDVNGSRILTQLYTREKGYTVIAWENREIAGEQVCRFWELSERDYSEKTVGDVTVIEPRNRELNYYVLRSPAFEHTGRCDRRWCDAYIRYLDNVLNGSNTVSERLGVCVVMSPTTPNNAPTAAVLTKERKDELEKELQQEYGMLRRQKQVMILPNSMQTQTINLAALDAKTAEKAKFAVLAICDRVKVPANQVALVDAASSKALANGTELREGDISKYRSFRRLLNATLYDMAVEIGLHVDYTIENEPKTVQGQTIEQ